MTRRFLTLLFGVSAAIALALPSYAANDALNAYAPRGFLETQILTAQGAATVSGSAVYIPATAISCVYTQASHTGSPSVTLNIQGQDPSSNLPGKTPVWITLLSSSAIVSDTSYVMSVGTGVATASNAGLGQALPYAGRTQVVVAGSGTPVVTATVGCSTTN